MENYGSMSLTLSRVGNMLFLFAVIPTDAKLALALIKYRLLSLCSFSAIHFQLPISIMQSVLLASFVALVGPCSARPAERIAPQPLTSIGPSVGFPAEYLPSANL